MLKHAEIAISKGNLHVIEAGFPQNSAVLFLHGWPRKLAYVREGLNACRPPCLCSCGGSPWYR